MDHRSAPLEDFDQVAERLVRDSKPRGPIGSRVECGLESVFGSHRRICELLATHAGKAAFEVVGKGLSGCRCRRLQTVNRRPWRQCENSYRPHHRGQPPSGETVRYDAEGAWRRGRQNKGDQGCSAASGDIRPDDPDK